jgi:hypothetical protein
MKKGFTIFFAVLISSLALTVGIVIYDILNRSLALSGFATQSQYAIYAADTGAECALYWDLKYINAGTNNNGGSGSVFSTSSADTLEPTSGALCNTQDVLPTTGSLPLNALTPPLVTTKYEIAGYASTTFWMSMGTTAAAPCAKVEIGKRGNPSQTLIISRGYNTCSPNALRLERTIQVSY